MNHLHAHYHIKQIKVENRPSSCLTLSMFNKNNKLHIKKSAKEDKKKFRPNPNLKLVDQVKDVLRHHQYAYRTQQSYRGWIIRYLKFYDMKRHPKDMSATETERFLNHLATHSCVVGSKVS